MWRSLAAAAGKGEVWASVWNSVSRGGLGFLVSVAIGTPLGVVVGRIRPVRTAVGPILSGLQNLPSVAWVPPAVIFFGVTPGTIYTVILLGAVPPIANGSLGHGLGQLLKQAQDTNDMALAFGTIALVLVVGIGVNQLVLAPVERRVLCSHGLMSTVDKRWPDPTGRRPAPDREIVRKGSLLTLRRVVS